MKLVTIAAAAALVLATTPEPERARVAGIALQADEQRRFVHGGSAGHVRTEWFTETRQPELARDCQGCHLYPARDQARDPQAVCGACHYDGSLQLELAPGTDPALARGFPRTPGRAFDHHDHRALECRRCHLPGRDRPLEPVTQTGSSSCFECHDPSTPSGKANEAPKTLAAFVLGMNSSRETEADPSAPFRHDEHVTGNPRDPATCLACHASIVPAKGNALGGQEFDLASCATCHRTESGAGAGFGVLTRERFESRSDGTFPHGPHLTEKAFTTIPELRQQGCLACHIPAEGPEGPTYGLPEIEGDFYGFCADCHYHGQEDKKIADHGTVDGCMGCHALEADRTDMATNRPKVEVRRATANRFMVKSQAHPFITGDEDPETCRKCHRAEVLELPSRIGEGPFSHDTHLPKDPKPEDCLPCHEQVTMTAGPEALSSRIFDPDLRACATCHLGAPVEVRPGPVEPRSVVKFPHDSHLTPEALQKLAEAFGDPSLATRGCLACHVPEQNGRAEVGTLETALACTQCHDHGTRPAITGKKDDAYVKQCGQCHAIGVPDKGVPVFDTRRAVKGTTARQWHPTDRACGECHRVLPKPVVRQPDPRTPPVLGRMSLPDDELHRTKGFPKDLACVACHWADAFGDPTRRNPPPEAGRPAAPLLRAADLERLGRSLEGYPGGPR